jgi:hypothetical protein
MAESFPVQIIISLTDKHYGTGKVVFLHFFINDGAYLRKLVLGLFFLDGPALYRKAKQ